MRNRLTLRNSVPLESVGLCALVLALTACSSVPLRPLPGPAAATVAVAERGWHTDICVRNEDAAPWVASLAHGFDGARFLCFGFGERDYIAARTPGPVTAFLALFPSPSAILMTVLRAPPQDALGAAHVTGLDISADGLAELQAFLQRSIAVDTTGQAVRLGDGPYPGSVFFAGTPAYDAFYTCNTWTADALRAAGLPVRSGVVFAGDLTFKLQGLRARTPPAQASPAEGLR